MRCELSPQAEIDLREIDDYIARDNPQRAASFVGELLAHKPKDRRTTRGLSRPARACADHPAARR